MGTGMLVGLLLLPAFAAFWLMIYVVIELPTEQSVARRMAKLNVVFCLVWAAITAYLLI